jgi:hypothetical protein
VRARAVECAMTGTEIVALVAVVVTGAVGFGAPIVTAWQQRKAEHTKYLRERRADAYHDALVRARHDLFGFRVFYLHIPLRQFEYEVAIPNFGEKASTRVRVGMYGSEQFRDVYSREWTRHISEVAGPEARRIAKAFRQAIEEEAGGEPESENGRFEEILNAAPHDHIHEIHKRAQEIYDRLENLAASELQGG